MFALPNALDARMAPAPPLADDGGSGSFMMLGVAVRALADREALGPALDVDDCPGLVAPSGRAFSAGALLSRSSAVSMRFSPHRLFLSVSASAGGGSCTSGMWKVSGERSTSMTDCSAGGAAEGVRRGPEASCSVSAAGKTTTGRTGAEPVCGGAVPTET